MQHLSLRFLQMEVYLLVLTLTHSETRGDSFKNSNYFVIPNILHLYFKSCLASKLACISFPLKELTKSPAYWAESEGHNLPFPHLQFLHLGGESVRTEMFLWL